MHFYEATFTAKEGFRAEATAFYPTTDRSGFVNFKIMKPGEPSFGSGHVNFTLSYAMADKARRIAAFINDVMAEDDTADQGLVEAIADQFSDHKAECGRYEGI